MPLPEKALIARIRHLAHPASAAIVAGIGDDCAVLRAASGRDLLVTTDFSLEGVHFRRDWHPPESIGHRCLARGFSDIAAMGGDPLSVFLSLALPRDVRQSWVGRFTRGLIRLAKKYDATLAGGDTAQSPGGIIADIIVIGAVPKGKAILRSGARPGDRIFVSGELGGSAAVVGQLSGDPKTKLNPRSYPRHFYPEPRLALGCMLRQKKIASAMIDTSDGLSTDLNHICEESGVGAEIDAALIPCARLGKPAHEVPLSLALHGGEDYELLFTARPGVRVPPQLAGVRLTQIGQIVRGRRVLMKSATGRIQKLVPAGWEHFRT